MDDVQYQVNQAGMSPNYYNQNNMQPNPMNNQPYAFNNQPPRGSYQPQPMYPPPPAPFTNQHNPINSAQPIVLINNPTYPPCPYCHAAVPTIARRVTGQAQIFWCFILFLVFPIACCIPFCM